jgi:YidC/Oxa1 family membrane protein insertase
MADLFHLYIFLPIYNALIFFVDIIPGEDLGVAVILATFLVKLILVPLSVSAVKTQRAMRVLEPELKDLKEKFKDNKEQQAREMLALYKKYNVKPFASILMLFIQIPIVLGLYFACLNVAKGIDPSLIYSFVPVPENVSALFLGIFAVGSSSIVLAFVAAATQFAQAYYGIPVPEKSTDPTPSMTQDLGRAMALQARFVFPIIIGALAYTSGALALYFAASNLFMLAQEFTFRRYIPHPEKV